MPRLFALGVLCAGLAAPVGADVVDAAANGFSIRVTTEIDAPSADVFRALTDQLGKWWDPAHSYSGNAANFTIDARAGGCFCEKLPTGGVQHMIVTHVEVPRTLVMQGALGPMATLGVSGAMGWTLDEHAGRTQLQVTYNIGGYMPGGLAPLAPAVDGVLAGQVKRLKRYVETGRPE
jgi:uncharacterized protein YndB with AHSA1/START domain